jgi:hypothetical protein
MATKPAIPMLPSDLPQQRLYLLRNLPAAPTGWNVKVKYPVTAIGPKTMPTSARYIGQAEWAWSPMHMRIDAYYLSMCSKHRNWLLWSKGCDDNWSEWMDPMALAYSPRCGLKATDAAQLLLAAYWDHERRKNDLDEYHWINEEVLLSAGQIQNVANAVWERASS